MPDVQIPAQTLASAAAKKAKTLAIKPWDLELKIKTLHINFDAQMPHFPSPCHSGLFLWPLSGSTNNFGFCFVQFE